MPAAELRTNPGRCILLVDDDPKLCELITEAVEDSGWRAECVQSDRDAYAQLSSGRRFVALVVDINLGLGTTGFDIARFARQHDPDLPIVYISGQTSMDSFRTFGVPGSTFVEKPFVAADLVRDLHQVIGDNDD